MTDIRKKLQIKDGMIGRIINIPKEMAPEQLISTDCVTEKKSGLNWVIAFVADGTDLKKYYREALDTVERDGIICFCYPKKSSGVTADINRDAGRELLDREA
ncbi:MAG TPA: hypothetical protein VMZ05_06205 [Spirochaetota bacterium]|nr:hypothetical protein [Spirochaetota bacterium]